MTFNEVFMAQNMARQRQTEFQQARHNDLLRTAREVHVAARRQRRALAKEARLQRRIKPDDRYTSITRSPARAVPADSTTA